MLVVARLRDGYTDDEFLRLLTDKVLKCKTGIYSDEESLYFLIHTSFAASGLAPLSVLRPVLFHMRSRPILDRLHAEFIRIFSLQESDSTVELDNIDLTAWTPQRISPLSSDTRREFRKSLTMHLFGWDVLMSLRMRLSLADYGWVSCSRVNHHLAKPFCSVEID